MTVHTFLNMLMFVPLSAVPETHSGRTAGEEDPALP